jgi:hypothetical protein
MKRFFVVLFVLCSLTGFAQVNRPANLSFNGLADFIRNFDFIASSTELPTIASKGVQLPTSGVTNKHVMQRIIVIDGTGKT